MFQKDGIDITENTKYLVHQMKVSLNFMKREFRLKPYRKL